MSVVRKRRWIGAVSFDQGSRRRVLLLALAGLLAVLMLRLLPPGIDPAVASTVPARRAVIFAGDHDYRPFDYLDDDGRPTGFDVELFRSIARHAGFDADIRLGAWEDVVADLGAGRVDVVPMLVTEERAKHYAFSEPFLHRDHLVFGRREGGYVERLQSLAGHRVAVQKSGMALEALEHVAGIELVRVDVESDALRAVQDGRADYALVPMFIGYEALQRYGMHGVVGLSPLLLQSGYAFAVPHGRDALLDRINAGLREASRSGEVNRLFMRWLANLTPSREVYRSGLAIGLSFAVALLVVSILLLVWWRRARRRAANESASRVEAESRAWHLAMHDPVTQLANRVALQQSLVEWIAADMAFAVIRIELSDLQAVGEVAGHDSVDELMCVLAGRLRRAFDGALLAKVSHSGFVVACPSIDSADRASAAMRALIDLVHERVEIAGVPLEQNGCAGAALFPQHADSAEALLRAAGVACVAACRHAGSGLLYAPSLVPDSRNLALLADLRQAIREQSLGYALQAKLNLATGRLAGAELLVRWTHPEHGALTPDRFVPLAEKTEVIGEMTVYLLRQAAGHCREWRRRGLSLCLSVNVSVNDLSSPAVVDAMIEASCDVADHLILEVTETAVMRDAAAAFAAVQRLRDCGLRVSVDDFGTGNASLTYLRRLAPDEVKIDRSFIAGIAASDADRAIVHSTIELAHSLGATVTAEGVEDAATLAWLKAAGCDHAQGFHIARPQPCGDFVAELAASHESPNASGPFMA